jgi:hypothetical protein
MYIESDTCSLLWEAFPSLHAPNLDLGPILTSRTMSLRPSRFTPEESAAGLRFVGDWEHTSSGLETMKKSFAAAAADKTSISRLSSPIA